MLLAMLHLVDGFSQTLNPLFAFALIVCAGKELPRPQLWWWLGRVTLAVLLAQGITKWVQHFHLVDKQFPSTHFVVALGIGGAFWALGPRFMRAALLFLVAYGALILVRAYHTPLDLMGAIPAFPLGFAAARRGTRRASLPSG